MSVYYEMHLSVSDVSENWIRSFLGEDMTRIDSRFFNLHY